MPTISSSRVQPLVTPSTELLTRARTRPCIAAFESSSRTTRMWPSFCSSFTPEGICVVTSPFGPLTRTVLPSTANVTPFASGIGLLPILDIIRSHSHQNLFVIPSERSESMDLLFSRSEALIALVNLAQDLAAHAFLARLASGHHALGRSQNVDAQPAKHAGNVRVPDVHAAAGARDPLQVRNGRRIIGAVLQIHAQDLAALFFGRLEVRNIALLLQNAGHLDLELRVGNVHFLLARLDGVTNTR